eukprot:TRINITY_DN725_c0_g2_i2.p1 TRINITY_DN725_c0_g2~~TRINITY_DN725_c0_g2_i2.p1  ORF type:complete len:266 (-),score=53.31 TRINITY_DN725_c0_g2_i2:207-1004(-)
MACHYEKQCEQTTEGIGKAIANIRKASEYIEILKKMEKFLSPTILSQYRDLSRFIIDKRKYLEDQNNKIYHEMVSTKVDEIEGINYGNPTPIDTELSRPFEGQEVFSRMIPPAVKMLEEEFKNEVGSVLNNAFSIAQRIDMDQDKLFMKYNLPACLHAVSGEQNIPEDLWVRIKSCKEKGGVTGLSQMIQSLHTMSENNLSQVSNLQKKLADEEAEDNTMRIRYGPSWNRMPSGNLNPAMKKQVQYYEEKLKQAKSTDEKNDLCL